MYKSASRNLQHRHAVDRPHPSRGQIETPSADDVLPDPETLTIGDLRTEQATLRREIMRVEQEIAVVKRGGTKEALNAICSRKTVLCARISIVNKTLSAKDGPSDLARFMRAARELLGDEQVDRIVERARELRND